MGNSLMKCRRPEGIVMSKSYSIYNQCRECHGWEGDIVDGGSLKDAVERCSSTKCPLWPYRLSKSSYAALHGEWVPREGVEDLEQHLGYNSIDSAAYGRTRAIKRFCRVCQGVPPKCSHDPVRDCESPQCWLYPHRMGTKAGEDI